MRKRIILTLITIISIIRIGHLIIEYIIKNNREKYHSTAECEYDELNYCKETFEIGITDSDFEKILEKKVLEYSLNGIMN